MDEDRDALALLGLKEPRLMGREELLTGWGHGWGENWMEGEDGEADQIVLTECVWCGGYLLVEGDSENMDSPWMRKHYNRMRGSRVWAGDRAPTDEERRAAAWM